MDAALDDLFADKGLLLLEQVVVGGDRQTADVQGVRAIGRPGDSNWWKLVRKCALCKS